MESLIYLDNNATTQPLPEVAAAMLPYLSEHYANPSSVHRFGQQVRHAVEVARLQVATLVGASQREILFTSGGTEAINMAIVGTVRSRPAGRHIVSTSVEHAASLRVLNKLEEEGFAVDYVGVDHNGVVDGDEWSARITPNTALVTLQHANNETGVMQDVTRLVSVARKCGVPTHVDAVQTIGKLPVDVGAWDAQLVTMAAHKFHGPKGVGALYKQRRTRIQPLLLGGSQEHDLRGGTENVAGIVGMGVAAVAAARDGRENSTQVRAMRDRLERDLVRLISTAHVNGGGAERVYNTTNISFEGLQAEAILLLLSEADICCSSGAACSSGSLEPSHVLKAMGLSERLAHGAIRFSLSRFTTQEQIDQVVRKIPDVIARLAAVQR